MIHDSLFQDICAVRLYFAFCSVFCLRRVAQCCHFQFIVEEGPLRLGPVWIAAIAEHREASARGEGWRREEAPGASLPAATDHRSASPWRHPPPWAEKQTLLHGNPPLPSTCRAAQGTRHSARRPAAAAILRAGDRATNAFRFGHPPPLGVQRENDSPAAPSHLAAIGWGPLC